VSTDSSMTETSSTTLPRIGIVTVTFNSSKVLPDFLRSISAQTHTNFHLYAVDNASSDSTIAQLHDWQPPEPVALSIISNSENRGAAEGNNQGIRAALADGCPLILFINNDVFFGPELLTSLLAGLSEHPCQLVCARIYYATEPTIIWAAGGEFQPRFGYRNIHFGQDQADDPWFDLPRPVTYAPTTCLLVQSDVFRRIGLLDPAYFAYHEDADWLLLAARAGLVMYYQPTARLWHKVSSLSNAEPSFGEGYGARNRVYFLRKNFSTPRSLFWNAAYLARYLARWIVRTDSTARLRIKASGWMRGWRMPLPIRTKEQY
jgi:GT2 family glycosyltransferase